MPYYAVQNGKSKGVYNNWDSCKSQVSGYSGAVYKKFNTAAEAQSFARGSSGYRGSGSGSSSSGSSSSTSSSGTRSSGSGSYSSTSSSSYSSGYSSGSASRSSGGISKPSHSNGYTGSSSNTSYIPSYSSGRSSSTKSSISSSTGAKKQSIYTDGASRGNGKSANPAAGYGVYYGENHPKNAAVPMLSVNGGNMPATNQRAELAGVKHALKDVLSSKNDGVSYTIKSDSKYAIEAVTNWLKNWEKNGYKTSNNQPVQNQDLIKECVDLHKQIKEAHSSNGSGGLEFEHVRGHQGIHGNEQADRLANLGADKDTK